MPDDPAPGGAPRPPLAGVRILDLGIIYAGPYGSMLLADWGAEVIRLENVNVFQPQTRGYQPRPSRDLVEALKGWRYGYPNYDPGPRPWNRHPLFHSNGRNKLSMTVDLRKPEGLDIYRRLIRISDVFMENNVPSTVERLGVVDYDTLRRENPGLIMLRMPAFGINGPYKNYRALGMHMEGAVGHTWVRGYTDSDPSMRGDIVAADATAGLAAAFAVVLALRHRRRTGQGQLIELATAENFIPFVSDSIMDYSMNGRVQGSLGNRHRWMAPHGCYPCQGEDRWIAIAVATDQQWQALCRVMGDPPWCSDERFADSHSRWRNQDQLDDHLAAWTRGQDATALMLRLQEHGVPAGHVANEHDVVTDPHLRARGFFQNLPHAEAGAYDYPATLWRVDGERNPLRLPPPLLGEHNEYVYKELLGYSDEDYRRLEAEGHVGMDYVDALTE